MSKFTDTIRVLMGDEMPPSDPPVPTNPPIVQPPEVPEHIDPPKPPMPDYRHGRKNGRGRRLRRGGFGHFWPPYYRYQPDYTEDVADLREILDRLLDRVTKKNYKSFRRRITKLKREFGSRIWRLAGANRLIRRGLIARDIT